MMKSKTAPTNTRILIKSDKSDAEKSVDDEASYGLTELLTAKELEAILKIDQKTIYRYVAAGSIPYVERVAEFGCPKSTSPRSPNLSSSLF